MLSAGSRPGLFIPAPTFVYTPMREISLTRGFVALVDDADAPDLEQFRWHYAEGGYARRSFREDGKVRFEFMHRRILGCPAGVEVDHINGEGLDNRRTNLRAATRSENARNSRKRRRRRTVTRCWSRYRGVQAHGLKWRADIRTDDGPKYLGVFPTEEGAAQAYDDAAREHHGEFARLNFPTQPPTGGVDQ